MKNGKSLSGEKRAKTALTAVFAVIAVVYILPIFVVLMNSFKANTYVKTATFAFPNAQTYVGFANYIKGMTFGSFPFIKSLGASFLQRGDS